LYQHKRKEDEKMMTVLEVVFKFVGIISNLIGIIEKITTYIKDNEKDPSGLTARDGSKDDE
jgi:hypothetical protein